MAGRIPSEFIDHLLARTDIVALIGSRLTLRKAGRNYQARCPFHDEKTPSFSVSPEKQFYHCFGCGAHGTAIGFLMEYNRLSFREAIEELAARAGVEIPLDDEAMSALPDVSPLLQLLEQANDCYRQQLRQHSTAQFAVNYLKQRGLTGAIAAHYQLGFAPPTGDFILSQLGKTAVERDRLLACGLLAERDGQRYDRFRNRILFPIRNRRGRVIGFGGRALGETKPKYLNSPETPVFHKGRELYGWFEAQQANRQLNTLLIVEGYLDVIALAQFGITNVVATLGTATTSEHLQLLRTVPELIFCFDGDRAGRAAAWKALEIALPLMTGQQTLRFLFLPEGDDPDTLIRREGADGLTARLAQASPLSTFLFAHLQTQVKEITSSDGRARLATLAKPLIDKVPSDVYRDLLTQELAEMVKSPRIASTAVAKKSDRQGSLSQKRIQKELRPTLIAQTIALLLANPELAAVAKQSAADWQRLPNSGVDILVELLNTLFLQPELTTAMLLERWREHPHFEYLQRLSVHPFLQDLANADVATEFRDGLQRLSDEVRKAEQFEPFH
ncbi:DNA primase [Chromatium weissei]|nr:DNA primase [Chromatium weissei]